MANLYLTALDRHVLTACTPFVYQRYIDDILVICWRREVECILKEAHLFQSSIKLNLSGLGRENVQFLDLSLSLQHANRVEYTIYHKPQSRHGYLPFCSTHPNWVYASVAFSEARRYLNRCSERNEGLKRLELLRRRLLRRGYPGNLVRSAFEKAKSVRTKLKDRDRKMLEQCKLFFVCRFSGSLNTKFVNKMLASLPTLPGRPILALKMQKNLFRKLYSQWRVSQDCD